MTVVTGHPAAQDTDEPQRIRSVSFIRFLLRFTEPGAVSIPGLPGRGEDVPWGRERAHLLADTDPWGRPHLPGTSLAGVLREMVRHAEGQQIADAWFGHLLDPGTGDPAEVDAQASLIWVLGTRPVDTDGGELTTVPTQIRASTAISRERGAAEENTLRVEELLPVGTRFEVFLRWDDAPVADLERLLARLAAWRPMIGRGVSRGRGQCTIENIRHGVLRLDSPEGLHHWLTISGPGLARKVAVTPYQTGTASAQPEPLLRLTMKIIGPLRVGSGEPPEPAGDDAQHVTPVFRDGDDYLLPGTGLKGLIRSRAEFILRSVGMTPSPCQDQHCGKCWTCHVFGHAGGQDLTAASVGARALIRVTDAVITDPVPVRRQHVAIDRFTGGAHPGLLYMVDALEGGTFSITVEPLADDVPENTLAKIRAVLRLVLQDLHDGVAGVGAGVARGYGSVSIRLPNGETDRALPSLEEARKVLAHMVAAGRQGERA
jgi:CRISPR/Cas system CSM-associated protein Csm3 (group 7 of RAMP superfamily)